ncbi:MAG: maltotransferase domain-containing protein, partial [Stellaceae bacterium]
MAAIAPAPAAAEAKAQKPRLRPTAGNHRIAIESVVPQVACGRFPVKRVVGDPLQVSADIFGDGHERLRAALLLCRGGTIDWRTAAMQPVDNDRWSGAIILTEPGRHLYAIEAWTDAFASWRDRLAAKRQAGQPLTDEFAEGVALLAETVRYA